MSVLLSESREPVTNKQQLVEYFSNAEKPEKNWLIGCEHEKFPFRLSTHKPVGYDEPNGMRDFLRGMEKEFGWKPVMEGDNIIGLSRDKSAISFEPGAQLELAGAPLKTLHEVEDENRRHLIEVNTIGQKLGIGFLGIGFHPTAKREDIPWVPKGRYAIMREYMKSRGTLGHDMMLRTCTVQVNLDYASEADMIEKFRISLALQPVATALFAASPFTEGKLNGYNSYRMHVWTDTDPDRSGAVPFAFETGFGYERYIDYALDVPMYFVWRDGKYIDCSGQSFRDFMKGKLPALPGELPAIDDWANHLTTLFPDVRLKKILEMRGADMGCAKMLIALPAFWTGLLYCSRSRDAAKQIIKDWNDTDRRGLALDTPRAGLNAEIRGRKVKDIAKELLEISREGLRRRAKADNRTDDSHFLDVLFEFITRGKNQSEWLMTHPAEQTFENSRLLPHP